MSRSARRSPSPARRSAKAALPQAPAWPFRCRGPPSPAARRRRLGRLQLLQRPGVAFRHVEAALRGGGGGSAAPPAPPSTRTRRAPGAFKKKNTRSRRGDRICRTSGRLFWDKKQSDQVGKRDKEQEALDGEGTRRNGAHRESARRGHSRPGRAAAAEREPMSQSKPRVLVADESR